MANTSILRIFILIATVLTAGLCVNIKPRSSWGATKAEHSPAAIHGAVDYVVIHHTNRTNECSTESECQERIKSMQSFHRSEYDFYDIKYNFIIGGDGNVYEGRGWRVEGRHLKGYDKKSVGIVFLGKFEDSKPSARMLQNAKDLIAKGIRRGYIKSNYKLYGHRQATNTTCPGTKLYNEIKTWPHWREIPSNIITNWFKNLG